MDKEDAERVIPIWSGTVPILRAGERRVEIQAELEAFYALPADQQHETVGNVASTGRGLEPETLVHLAARAYATGDKRRFASASAALFKRAGPLLWGMAPKGDQEDWAQTIMMKVHEAVVSGNSEYLEINFGSFAKRRSIDLHRRQRAQFEGANKRAEPYPEEDPLDAVASPTRTPEEHALLTDSIEAVSPKHRLAFIQRHVMGLTLAEIADHHGKDVRTIQNWLKEADQAAGLKGVDDDR